MQENNYRFLILFDKKTKINEKFFNKNIFLKKINKNRKVIFGKLSDIKKFNLIILIGFTKKIKLKNNKKYFTIHESNLPKGRGFSPIKHQIMKGKKNIICSCIILNNKIDAGKIIFKDKLKINKSDFFDEIKKKQMNVTVNMLARLINNYPRNVKAAKDQKGKASYFKKLTKESDKININKSLISQIDKIRSTNYFEYKNFFYFKKRKFFLKIY